LYDTDLHPILVMGERQVTFEQDYTFYIEIDDENILNATSYVALEADSFICCDNTNISIPGDWWSLDERLDERVKTTLKEEWKSISQFLNDTCIFCNRSVKLILEKEGKRLFYRLKTTQKPVLLCETCYHMIIEDADTILRRIGFSTLSDTAKVFIARLNRLMKKLRIENTEELRELLLHNIEVIDPHEKLSLKRTWTIIAEKTMQNTETARLLKTIATLIENYGYDVVNRLVDLYGRHGDKMLEFDKLWNEYNRLSKMEDIITRFVKLCEEAVDHGMKIEKLERCEAALNACETELIECQSTRSELEKEKERLNTEIKNLNLRIKELEEQFSKQLNEVKMKLKTFNETRTDSILVYIGGRQTEVSVSAYNIVLQVLNILLPKTSYNNVEELAKMLNELKSCGLIQEFQVQKLS